MEDEFKIVQSIIVSNFNNNKTSLEPILYTDNTIVYKLFSRRDVICILSISEDQLIIRSEIVVDQHVIHTVETTLNIMAFDGTITDDLLGL